MRRGFKVSQISHEEGLRTNEAIGK